jgi:hypothetical protein
MLISGKEKPEKIKILISLTKIKSDELTNAILGYYCLGVRLKVDKSNWRRAINKMEETDKLIQKIKELDDE